MHEQPLVQGLLVVGAGFGVNAIADIRASESGAAQARFVYCAKGRGWCEAGGRLHAVGPGDLLVSPPAALQALGVPASASWMIHWVHAIGSHVPEYLRGLGISSLCPVLHVGEDPQLVRLFNEILVTLRRGSEFPRLLKASHALAYALALLTQMVQEKRPDNPDHLQSIASAIIYLTEHLNQPLRVPDLARLANLSPAYFTELFRQQTGCSPREYIHLLRIHRACQLLQARKLNVKEIASQLGYADPLHFSRQFKAFQGVSPTEYRVTNG